ncbi:MAG: hypothetical protein HKN29_10835 [Rhodothermales bacterium]|nr:hypothetical protein [Rhodothermales bacterium]
MALYAHQEATLGDIEGSGYLFRQRTALGETYRGVFFGPDGESTELESLVEEESVTFSGVLYKKTLSGKISQTKVEVPVDVKSYREVSMGDRALLEALEV